MIARLALSVVAVVRAGAPFEKTEALERGELVGPRIGNALFEPANHARALARKDDTALPGLAQDAIDALSSPDRKHVHRIAAADENGIGRQQLRFHVPQAVGIVEQPQVA